MTVLDRDGTLGDFAVAFNCLSSEGRLRYFAKKDEITTGGEVTSAFGLARAAAALTGFNFYINLNPSNWTSIKAKTSDITAFHWMVFDLDPPHGEVFDRYGCAELVALRKSIFAILGNGIKEVIVHSGRGYQVWVPIENTDLYGTTSYEWNYVLRELHKAVAGGIVGPTYLDLSCAEVSRVVRCPGTANTKTGLRAEVASYFPGASVDFQALLDVFGPAPEPSSALPTGTVTSLNPSSLSFIYSGANGHRESRHRRLYSTARNLYEIGIPKDSAYSWLVRGCELTSPRFEEGDDRAIAKVVNQIWR